MELWDLQMLSSSYIWEDIMEKIILLVAMLVVIRAIFSKETY